VVYVHCRPRHAEQQEEDKMTTTPASSVTDLVRSDTAGLRISLPDIARLAQVQRPVVSMWRTRSARSDHPFPAAVAAEHGQDWFALDELVDWLEATGRDKNGSVREDAPGFASVAGQSVKGDETLWVGLTAMICLSASTDRNLSGQTKADLLDLADDIDPDDEFLYSELAHLDDKLESVANYAEQLCNAAYSPAAAFEQLMSQRFRLFVPAHSAVALVPPARHLVASLLSAWAASVHRPDELMTFVDPTPGGSDLLVELAEYTQPSQVLSVRTAGGSSAAARLASRRMWVHDIHHQALTSDGYGGFELPPGAVMVAQYPNPGCPEMSDLQILDAVDSLVLQRGAHHYGVVIGPASALTDEPLGSLTAAINRRVDILNSGRLRAVVRLPTGLLTTRPRRRLALWILGPEQVGVDRSEWFAGVADLANVDLSDGNIDILVTDLVAHLHGWVQHHPHFVRGVPTAQLRKGRTLFPPMVIADLRIDSAADIVLRAQDAVERLASPVECSAAPNVSIREAEVKAPGSVVLGVAASNRDIQVLPGHRINSDHVTLGPGTKVLGVPELTGEYAVGQRRIDRLVFAQYGGGKYTEPGDVVFCHSPRPAALVDRQGGSVVVYPARIIRSRDSSFVPAVLAADINCQPGGAKVWKAWSIRRVPADQTGPLSTALADFARERDALLERISRIEQAIEEVTTAVTSGEAIITPDNKDR